VVKVEDKTIGGLNLDGHVFVPIRDVAEILGLEVGWDGATNTVTLTKK
jgi:hypothetical protein